MWHRTTFLKHNFHVKNKLCSAFHWHWKRELVRWKESAPYFAACPGAHQELSGTIFFIWGSFLMTKNNRRELGKWFSFWWSACNPFQALGIATQLQSSIDLSVNKDNFHSLVTQQIIAFVEIKIVSFGRSVPSFIRRLPSVISKVSNPL